MVLGMTVGAVGGGILMKIGRRRAVLVACTFGMVGILMTLKLNIYMLVAGRWLFGFSVGLFSSICPRFNEETIPQHLYDTLAISYNVSQGLGSLIAFFFGEIIPPDTDTNALMKDTNWRIIYVYFPLSLYAFIILSFSFFL